MNKPITQLRPVAQADAAGIYRRQSIVFLATAHDNGGSSILGSNLAEAMRKQGHAVEEWYLFGTPSDLPPDARVFHKRGRSASPFTLLTVFLRLVKALRHRRPDAVFGLQPLSNILAAVAGRLAGIRNCVATLHIPADRCNRLLMTIDRFIGRRGAYRHIIACARSVAESFHGYGPDYVRRITVVPNGHKRPSLVARDAARRELGLPTDGIVLGQLGRLHYQKNQSFSLDLLKNLPGLSLLFVGIGPDQASLEAEIRAAGLTDRVRIVPSIEHARIGLFYSAVDLVLCPSLFEGLSLATIEAIHAGVPPICSDIPSFREMFGDSPLLTSTLIVPIEDRAAWLERIRALLSDDMLRTKVDAELRRLSPAYAFETMAVQYLHLLD